jgi:hypothetical protein
MIYERHEHTSSVLTNGNVLVTGGWGRNDGENSAELYDPSTGTWSTTSSMNDARSDHTSSILRNGKVLVIGGETPGVYLKSAELYSP